MHNEFRILVISTMENWRTGLTQQLNLITPEEIVRIFDGLDHELWLISGTATQKIAYALFDSFG